MGSQSDHEGAVHEIYPGGDTIFVCGPDKVKLLVHSIFLTNASTVFAAMFGPFFHEGQPKSTPGPREIPLLEDDPLAMQVIFSVIHSRCQEWHERMSPKQLLSIAYAADKYDLVPTMKYASSYWLSSIQSPGQRFLVETHLDNMKAAYLFENADAFQEASSAIILGYSGPFLGLSSHFDDVMPRETIFMLEEKRTKIRFDTVQLLWPPNEFLWSSNKMQDWINLIQKNELRPKNIPSSSLTETIAKIRNAFKLDAVQASGIFESNPQLRLRIVTELNRLKGSAGICLQSLGSRT